MRSLLQTKSQSISFKIGLLASLIIVAVGNVVGWAVKESSLEELVKHERVDLKEEMRVTVSDLNSHISLMREDLYNLAGSEELQRFLESSRTRGPELADRRAELKQLVLGICNWDSAWQDSGPGETAAMGPRPYLRVRLTRVTDNQSAEDLLRLETDENFDKEHGDHRRTLRDTRDDGARKLDSGELFALQKLMDELDDHLAPGQRVRLSSVQAVIDKEGEEQVRYPVIHAGMTLPGDSNSVSNLLVISLDLREIYREVINSPRHHFYLVDNKGQFLFHPRTQWQFAAPAALPGDDSSGGSTSFRHLKDEDAFRDELIQYFSPDYFDKNRDLASTGHVINDTGAAIKPDLLPGYRLVTLRLERKSGEPFDSELTDEVVKEALRKVQQDHSTVTMSRSLSQTAAPTVRLSVPLDEHETHVGDLEICRDKLVSKLAELKIDAISVYGKPYVDCASFYAHFYRMYYDPDDADRHFGVIMAFSHDELMADTAPVREKTKLWILGCCVVGTLMAVYLGQRLATPLKQTADAAGQIARGNYDVKLPTHRRDEVGDLARRFDEMVLEIQSREARLKMIFDAAAEGIVTVDTDGDLQSVNAAACRMLGIDSTEAAGHRLSQFIAAQDHQTIATTLHNVHSDTETETTFHHEVTGVRSDGLQFPLEISISSIAVDSCRLFTLILRDITERKRAEEQLSKWNEHLQRAVDEQTRELKKKNAALQEAKERAEELDVAKNEFVARVSHELRNPLNQVKGFRQLLEMTDLDDEQREDLRRIGVAEEQLLALVNDILDYQKIVMRGMEVDCEELDAVTFLEELRYQFMIQPNPNQNERSCHWEEDVHTLHADKQRLRQVLLNLLSNAMKFTRGGRVELAVRSRSDDQNRWVELLVSDNGRGMTPEEQTNLFIPFKTMARRETSEKSTGLGLVISEGLCRLMGGRIIVRSEKNRGSTFAVLIPAGPDDVVPREADAGILQQTELAAGTLHVAIPNRVVSAAPDETAVDDSELANTARVVAEPGATVLVIDDDPAMLQLMDRLLSIRGFHVLTADSGGTGLELARTHRPSVITLDAIMPDLDGWAVLSALKSDPMTKSIPVIMVTVTDDESQFEELGADGYVSKPVDWHWLSRVLSRYTAEGIPQSILMVEDDPLTRQMLTRLLASDEWKVTEAENGKEALKLLEFDRPDAILLDLMMPVMDGFEFLEELKGRPELLSIPIVVLTSMDPTPDQRSSLDGLVKCVLRKGSVSNQELIREVSEHTHHHTQIREKG